MEEETKTGKAFAELIAIMARLRGDRGCPWDREQTHASLKPFLLEEAYELLEAIEREDFAAMEEELGDLLLQILFHCQLASEKGRFGVERVLARLKEKLVRRHPHVFSDHSLPDSQAVLQHWAKAKAREGAADVSPSALGKLPKAMPALARAQRVGERASSLGFDWSTSGQIWDKLGEEMGELQTALSSGNRSRLGEEMGDVLFTLVNLCRFLRLEAEESLTGTIERFLRRFGHIEARAREKGKSFSEISFEEMNSLWEEAKERER